MAPTHIVPATSERAEETLLDKFNTYFRAATEVAGKELQEALRIRYQVYRVEKPFENLDDHPDGLERDEFVSAIVDR